VFIVVFLFFHLFAEDCHGVISVVRGTRCVSYFDFLLYIVVHVYIFHVYGGNDLFSCRRIIKGKRHRFFFIGLWSLIVRSLTINMADQTSSSFPGAPVDCRHHEIRLGKRPLVD
jgi:hypothetical protein